MESGSGITFDKLRAVIDYTLLKPEKTEREYVEFLEEALKWSFGSVFVPPCYVAMASSRLHGSGIRVGAPVSFPYGFMTPETKADEAIAVLEDGAAEIDVVMNLSEALSGKWDVVAEDLMTVSFAVREWENYSKSDTITLKVILETPLLTDEMIVEACLIAEESGFNYVKTATGTGFGGAEAADVLLMKRTVGDRLGIKASGGIRSFDNVREMLLSGADRIGTSAGPQILEDYLEESGRR